MKNKSKSHKSKFTGIFDKNGVPIMNGDKINVLDTYSMKQGKNAGTVVWKNGCYYCKGTFYKYNIWAWRKSIVVIYSNRPSIYEEFSYNDAAEAYRIIAAPVLKKISHYDVIKAFQAGIEFEKEQQHLKK